MVAEIKLRDRHTNQDLIIKSAKRFNVLKCGRRFGKTSVAEELIIDPALDGFPVAYYAPTYKDLDEFWQTIKSIVHDIIATKNEQLKQIRLITGGVIDMWSLDTPDSGRGRKYKRVVIDECEKARHLKTAWNGTIRATLTDYKGDAWFLSTPQFGRTYFKELHKRADDRKYQHEWMSWTFSTYDNPFMDSQEIDSARATLDPLYFACEYLAEDVSIDSMRWAYAYDENKHLSQGPLQRLNGEPLILSFDFNKNPMSCIVAQVPNFRTVRILEAIKLPNSDIYQMCDYIISKYGNTLYLVTGDASGKNHSAMVQDNFNYYSVIKLKFGIGNKQLLVPMANPRISENRMLVNSLLSRGDVLMDYENTKALQFDLDVAEINQDGELKKENREDMKQQLDLLDCLRYLCNTFCIQFSVSIEFHRK